MGLRRQNLVVLIDAVFVSGTSTIAAGCFLITFDLAFSAEGAGPGKSSLARRSKEDNGISTYTTRLRRPSRKAMVFCWCKERRQECRRKRRESGWEEVRIGWKKEEDNRKREEDRGNRKEEKHKGEKAEGSWRILNRKVPVLGRRTIPIKQPQTMLKYESIIDSTLLHMITGSFFASAKGLFLVTISTKTISDSQHHSDYSKRALSPSPF